MASRVSVDLLVKLILLDTIRNAAFLFLPLLRWGLTYYPGRGGAPVWYHAPKYCPKRTISALRS